MKALFLSAASVGIIGGADGPTAIFVTGPLRAKLLLALCAIAALALFALIRHFRRHK